jgi:hypothetical protein
MERTANILDEEAAALGQRLTLPCDEQGTPRRG